MMLHDITHVLVFCHEIAAEVKRCDPYNIKFNTYTCTPKAKAKVSQMIQARPSLTKWNSWSTIDLIWDYYTIYGSLRSNELPVLM